MLNRLDFLTTLLLQLSFLFPSSLLNFLDHSGALLQVKSELQTHLVFCFNHTHLFLQLGFEVAPPSLQRRFVQFALATEVQRFLGAFGV